MERRLGDVERQLAHQRISSVWKIEEHHRLRHLDPVLAVKEVLLRAMEDWQHYVLV